MDAVWVGRVCRDVDRVFRARGAASSTRRMFPAGLVTLTGMWARVNAGQ